MSVRSAQKAAYRLTHCGPNLVGGGEDSGHHYDASLPGCPPAEQPRKPLAAFDLLMTEPDQPLALHTVTTGEGPAAVFVHGIADDSAVWAAAVAVLSEHCCCTAIDLPGHGRSPNPTEPAAYEREALLAALDRVLARTGPAVLIGHSLGGYLGLAHAITRPGVLQGLVLVAAGPGFRDAAAMKKWNDRVHLSAPRMKISPVAASAGLHVDSLVINGLQEITIPVGLLVGSQDKAFLGANDYLERKLPNARRRTVEGGRHRLMRTHPDEVAAMTLRVLAATPTSPAQPPGSEPPTSEPPASPPPSKG